MEYFRISKTSNFTYATGLRKFSHRGYKFISQQVCFDRPCFLTYLV